MEQKLGLSYEDIKRIFKDVQTVGTEKVSMTSKSRLSNKSGPPTWFWKT